MRYEAGICTIVISMNGWCPFRCRLDFDPKSWKTMDYCFWSIVIFDRNVTEIKSHFKDIIWKLFSCWPQWHNFQLHISITYLTHSAAFSNSIPNATFGSLVHFWQKWHISHPIGKECCFKIGMSEDGFQNVQVLAQKHTSSVALIHTTQKYCNLWARITTRHAF